MGKHIPDAVLEGRSQLGKELAIERYYKRECKSLFYAYILWFLLSLFAAHRFYLGYWKSGLVYMTVMCAMFILPIIAFSLTAYAQLVMIALFLFDAVMLPKITRQANLKIRQALELELF